mgnify:CR=1 FL=1
MRHKQHSISAAVDREQQLHDLIRRLFIEISGGLVGEENNRIIYKRAGDGNALTLTARQLPRKMLQAPFDAQKACQLTQPCLIRSLPSSSSGMMMFSSAVRIGIRLKS